MLFGKCPGAQRLRSPEITEKLCPECGREIEIFSTETHAKCECGFVAYNDAQSCIRWCAYARQCVGEEIFNRFNNITSLDVPFFKHTR